MQARTVGAFANHVLAGVHLHATRAVPVTCDTQFKDLAGVCKGQISRMPYGIDPAFKETADYLYEDSVDDEATKLSLYNCSELDGGSSSAIDKCLIVFLAQIGSDKKSGV